MFIYSLKRNGRNSLTRSRLETLANLELRLQSEYLEAFVSEDITLKAFHHNGILESM